MLEDERVHIGGRADEPDARGILVHQEDGRLRRVAVDVRVDEEEVGHVAGRHVPLLAAEDPVVSVAGRRRRNHRHVRARPFFGDRVGVPALARTCRPQEAILLLGRPRGERDRRSPGDVPQGAGRAAPLLFDQHHLESVVAPASVLACVVDGVELPVEHRALGGGGARRGETVVFLAFELERLEHLIRERTCLALQRSVVGRQPDVHGSLLG